MGRPITHFEIASPNLESATEFYRQLFDWSVGEELIDGYRLVQTAEGSIEGGLLRTPQGVFPYVTIYVSVADLRGSPGAARRSRRGEAEPEAGHEGHASEAEQLKTVGARGATPTPTKRSRTAEPQCR